MLAIYYWVRGAPRFDQRRLIETWWRYDRSGRDHTSPDFWASDLMSDITTGADDDMI